MAYEVFVYDTTLRIEVYEMAARELRTMAAEVVELARLYSVGPYSKDGRLAADIQATEPQDSTDYVTATVNTGNNSYANIVESGARIHEIFPKGAGKYFRFGEHRKPQLHFFWRNAGKMVYTPHVPMSPGTIGVSHPGMQGKHFMSRALNEVGIRHNFLPSGPGISF